jgi:hypothetical protein
MGTVQKKGVLPLLVHWALNPGTREFCPSLAALVSPIQNIFVLTVRYFNSFVSITQQAGQAAVQGGLSLSVCLCLFLYKSFNPLCGSIIYPLPVGYSDYDVY